MMVGHQYRQEITMKITLIFTVAALILAGCATARDQTNTTRDAEIAAKQGKEVRQICFAQNINGWRAFGRDSVLLQKGVNDWYRVELTGSCEPERAFNVIALRSRPAGSPCLSRGDNIDTPDIAGGQSYGSCFISKIYEWDEKAKIPTGTDDE
jgi:hypothetical protein